MATKPKRKNDYTAEAHAVAEKQLAEDRAMAMATLTRLGDAITGRRKVETARALVELLWLEHRITQQTTMHTALWCRECAATGRPGVPGEMPPAPAPWMVFECLEHADTMIERSTKSWIWELFGGLS